MKDSPQKPSTSIYMCVYDNVDGGLLPQNGDKYY